MKGVLEFPINSCKCEFSLLELDRGHYFESVLLYMQKYNLIKEEKLSQIFIDLQALLKEKIDHYTSFESTSVRIETAQGILESIYYSIGLALKEMKSWNEIVNEIESGNFNQLLKQGQHLIEERLQASKLLWEELKKDCFLLPCIAYYDTICTGILQFFQKYEYKYASHESPGSIDYPLCYDPMDMTGVEYIFEYLTHLSMEVSVLKQFDPKTIENLMQAYSKHYKEDLFNVYDLIRINLIGNILLSRGTNNIKNNKNVRTKNQTNIIQSYKHININQSYNQINISKLERQELYRLLKDKSMEDLKQLFTEGTNAMLDQLMITEDTKRAYLGKGIEQMVAQVQFACRNETLHRVFLSCEEDESKEDLGSLKQVPPLKNHVLRSIMEEIQLCTFLEDKINLIKRAQISIEDFNEILNECFINDEIEIVFNHLNEVEQNVLCQYLKKEKEYYGEDYFIGSWKEKIYKRL